MRHLDAIQVLFISVANESPVWHSWEIVHALDSIASLIPVFFLPKFWLGTDNDIYRNICYSPSFSFLPTDAETIVDEDSEVFIRENLLLLDIFYAEDGRQVIIHRPAYDFYSLICDIGGALALLCGASVLTR